MQSDGSLWAWGYDGHPAEVTTTNSPAELYVGRGALGLGNRVTDETIIYTNADTTVTTNNAHYASSAGLPARIGTDSDWLTVAPGSEHALALKKNGSLWSWGYDGMGQFLEVVNAGTNRRHNYAKGALGLGVDLLVSTWALTNHTIGSAEEAVYNEYVAGVMTPTQVGTSTNWVAAAAGWDHSLAVKADGSLYAWGQNAWNQEVYVLTDATHYAAVDTNLYGVLGLGNAALLSTNTPTRVGTDSDWRKVAAGASISFAIKKDGSLWAWGDNGYLWNDWFTQDSTTSNYAFAYGRLGLGTNVLMTNLPTRVGTDNDWVDIAVSMINQTIVKDLRVSFLVADVNQQCLALKSDGSLWAWGYSWFDYDILFYHIIPYVQAVPIRVGKENDWIAISAGMNHSLALKTDGSLWAWGDNGYGQLGNNNSVVRDPVQVGSLFTWGYARPVPATDAGGADYDGDGLADFVLYDAAGATLLVRLSTRGWDLLTFNLPIGGPGYRLVAADFDGDGLADPAVYQESTGNWQVMFSCSGYNLVSRTGFLGGSGCAAAAADYDGDGLADPAVYKDGTAEWRIRASQKAYMTILETLGGAGSVAVPADYNNDGKAEVATYQPSTGTWKVMFGSSVAPIAAFGGLTYIPAVADYDGDGQADPAVYEPGTGRLRIQLSMYNYWEYDSAAYGVFLGGSMCVPVSADYDGDGLADPAVYNYSTGKWTVLLSRYTYARWTSPW